MGGEVYAQSHLPDKLVYILSSCYVCSVNCLCLYREVAIENLSIDADPGVSIACEFLSRFLIQKSKAASKSISIWLLVYHRAWMIMPRNVQHQ